MKTIAAVLAFLVLSVLPAAAAKRIALVIGNSDYGHVIDLKNPVNDADLMEKTLRDVGFDVTRLSNLDQRGMKQAMVDYARKLKDGADASMFYYAGHGIELDGQNYLVPVDADTRSKDEADIQNVSVNSFLSLMENSGVPLNIVILDACRNNPFRSMRSASDGGLAPVKAPRGTYVAYATAPGTVAADGDGGNSPFTLALAESITQPGLTLEAVLKRARSTVYASTKGAQLPFDSSAITGEFYFLPPVAQEPKTVPEADTQTLLQPKIFQTDPAQESYEAAGNDADLLQVVIDNYGSTIWGALAREKLKRNVKPKVQDVTPTTKTAEEPVADKAPVADDDDGTPAVQPKIEVVTSPATKAKPETVKRKVADKKAKAKSTPVVKKQPERVAVPKKVKLKPAVANLTKRKNIAVAPKVKRANYPSCNSSFFMSRGALCSRGAAVCRVADSGVDMAHLGSRSVHSCH